MVVLPEFFQVTGLRARLQSLMRTGRYQFFITAIGLLVAVFLCFGSVLGQYWTADDPPLLASIVHNGIWSHFYDPAIWAYHLPEPPMWGVFTPWVMLSMGIDWWFGKFDPHFAYIHQLLSFWAALILLYVVLRRFFTFSASLYVCVLFAASPPARESVHYIMERHYIEGLALFLGSVMLYDHALAKESGRWPWACASALLYLTACLAKEIYAPLAALLPLLPWGTWRQRWVLLTPHAVMAALYISWRAYMLSPDFMLGYGGGHIQLNLHNWLNIWNVGLLLNLMAAPWQKGILSLTGLLFVACLGGNWRAWLRTLALLVLTVLPLYPLLDMLQIRLYYLPLLALIIAQGFVFDWFVRRERWHLPLGKGRFTGFALAFDGLWISSVVGVVFALLFVPSLILPHQSISKEALSRFRQEGEHALHASATEALVHPTTWPLDFWWYFTALAALRYEKMHDLFVPPVCYDPCICSRLQPHEAIKFSPKGKTRTLWPVSYDPEVCGDETSPLSLNITLDESRGYPIMQWKLGPYGSNGYYELLFFEKNTHVAGFGYPVRPNGKHPVGHGRLIVRVRWLSFEGWSSVSPPFEIAPGMEPINWSRREQEEE